MESLRDDILKLNDLEYKEIEVPEWKKTLVVRSLNGTERDAYELSLSKDVVTTDSRGRKRTRRKFDGKYIRAKLVQLAVCRAVGDPTPVFKESDIPALSSKNGAALDRVYDAVAALNGLSDNDVDEELKKFDADPA